MNAQQFDFLTDSELTLLERYQTCKAMARGYAGNYKSDKDRLAHARSYCAHVIGAYWDSLAQAQESTIKIKSVPHTVFLAEISCDALELAKMTGDLIATFPVEDAGYLIGSIYTVMLPSSYRSEIGAYYTPPPLVARLLDLAESTGVDFSTSTAIDPACGGGAFLAPVALRMLQKEKGSSPEWILRRLVKRLKGIEIDPFAAWMTLALLEAALMPLCIAAKRRLPDNVIIVGDALQQSDVGHFDLVIGNPPYGRVTLNSELRDKYSRSLYGHANLYGLFTDLAIRLAKPQSGIVAYLTPTSFLGGQYFMALRKLLTEEATPFAFDFISDREGVFDDVLQETLLTTFRLGKYEEPSKVSSLIPKGLNDAKVEKIGNVKIEHGGSAWLLPRNAEDAEFLNAIKLMPNRLSDFGYNVSTGQLVWNRFKSQLRTVPTKKSYPLIWAESITNSGFNFSSDRRNHVPFIDIHPDQSHLLTSTECVLVQRTTSKEQSRRLLAAVLPQAFLDKNRAVVVENHINMIYPNELFAQIKPETVAAILNSKIVDRAFRCISGSVAVSAYELNSIPLPSVDELLKLEKLVLSGSSSEKIEKTLSKFYGVNLK